MIEQTQQMQTKKKVPALLSLVALIGLLLTTLLAAALPAFAQQQGPVTATGLLQEAAPHTPDPTPIYAITDEATGNSYELTSGFVDLQSYVGQRVAIEGVPVPGPGDPSKPPLLNVTQIQPAGNPNPDESAKLSFELTVEGEPPAGARFFGAVPAEGCISVPLTDPDGDGLYTGSTNVPKFAPGGPAEPVSLPVQIVQANSGAGPCNPTSVIKDFGQVKIDGDKTFSAGIYFADDGGVVVCQSLDCPEVPDSGDEGSGSDNPSEGDSDNSGSANDSSNSNNQASSDDEGSGAILGGITKLLPSTGGSLAIIGVVGALLVAGGLLARRLFR